MSAVCIIIKGTSKARCEKSQSLPKLSPADASSLKIMNVAKIQPEILIFFVNKSLVFL
jgi:hypothetical protein